MQPTAWLFYPKSVDFTFVKIEDEGDISFDYCFSKDLTMYTVFSIAQTLSIVVASLKSVLLHFVICSQAWLKWTHVKIQIFLKFAMNRNRHLPCGT